jgi:hypothetical protein
MTYLAHALAAAFGALDTADADTLRSTLESVVASDAIDDYVKEAIVQAIESEMRFRE